MTMTAELSDVFRTKREGVGFVLDAVEAVSRAPVRVFTTAGEFVDPAAARARPLDAAASNWVATAMLVGRFLPDALLVDVGSTTTDVIPVTGGRVAALGRTDPERLLAGELVYTGALRTNVAAIVRRVPLRGGECPVASELFAQSGDAHVLLGSLAPEDYTCPTPDGRPPTPEFAGERLARVVCADGEMLGAGEIRAIAAAVAEAQVEEIAAALGRVARRLAGPAPVITTGLGSLPRAPGRRARRAAGQGPRRRPRGRRRHRRPRRRRRLAAPRRGQTLTSKQLRAAPARIVRKSRPDPEWVIKVGGSLGARPARLRRLMGTLATAARRHWLVVVPGGGGFADEVRRADRRFALGDSAAHWMAILAMDQYGYLLARLAPGAALVRSRRELAPGRLNVLAPSAWLLGADPLPHSWDVTSDSIAAWIARALRARRLMLVKHVDGFIGTPARAAKPRARVRRSRWRGTRLRRGGPVLRPGAGSGHRLLARPGHAARSGSRACSRPVGPTGPRSSGSAKPAGAGMSAEEAKRRRAHLRTRSAECVAERA